MEPNHPHSASTAASRSVSRVGRSTLNASEGSRQRLGSAASRGGSRRELTEGSRQNSASTAPRGYSGGRPQRSVSTAASGGSRRELTGGSRQRSEIVDHSPMNFGGKRVSSNSLSPFSHNSNSLMSTPKTHFSGGSIAAHNYRNAQSMAQRVNPLTPPPRTHAVSDQHSTTSSASTDYEVPVTDVPNDELPKRFLDIAEGAQFLVTANRKTMTTQLKELVSTIATAQQGSLPVNVPLYEISDDTSITVEKNPQHFNRLNLSNITGCTLKIVRPGQYIKSTDNTTTVTKELSPNPEQMKQFQNVIFKLLSNASSEIDDHLSIGTDITQEDISVLQSDPNFNSYITTRSLQTVGLKANSIIASSITHFLNNKIVNAELHQHISVVLTYCFKHHVSQMTDTNSTKPLIDKILADSKVAFQNSMRVLFRQSLQHLIKECKSKASASNYLDVSSCNKLKNDTYLAVGSTVADQADISPADIATIVEQQRHFAEQQNQLFRLVKTALGHDSASADADAGYLTVGEVQNALRRLDQSFDADADGANSHQSSRGLIARAAELAQREANLAQREADLAQRERSSSVAPSSGASTSSDEGHTSSTNFHPSLSYDEGSNAPAQLDAEALRADQERLRSQQAATEEALRTEQEARAKALSDQQAVTEAKIRTEQEARAKALSDQQAATEAKLRAQQEATEALNAQVAPVAEILGQLSALNRASNVAGESVAGESVAGESNQTDNGEHDSDTSDDER